MKNTISVIATISVLVLGYGYWHSRTHGAAHIDLVFKTSAGISREVVPGIEISFLNTNGAVLAKGISDGTYSFIHLIHPDAGDCHDVKASRDLWKECFQRHAVWIPQWIKDVNQVDIKFKNCRLTEVPVVVVEHNSEWFLWWVPHPHIGGIPYTYFRSTIVVDEAEVKKEKCRDQPG